jgi:hypothetical protein
MPWQRCWDEQSGAGGVFVIRLLAIEREPGQRVPIDDRRLGEPE